ncbi:MAG: bifunctional lysylphosphatidylglycerol flippase/synthetase MprF, partial [Phycisphaerales bacterium]|nr:bifunctional lysylphosphatidylglycerol flippase/synthetase MprF [Phycisphaerales bacterium]
LLALILLLSGAILLFSGASPASGARLQWLRWAVPLPLIELSHFLGSLVGASLLILARAIQRRSIAAYYGASAALALGVVVSLGKGWDYEEAIVLSLALLALLPSRRHFYRRASIAPERFTPGWIAMIAGVVLCTTWLVLFAYKHVEYRNDLWWEFSLHGDAPRSLRALVGAGAMLFFYGIARFLGPARTIAGVPSRDQLGAAAAIIASSKRADANLALLGDKTLLFNRERTAFVMYAVSGRSWISMGDPVGPVEERRDLAWAFHEQCDICGDMTVFYEIPEPSLATYAEMGLGVAKIGEEASVPLTTFSLQGAERRELRQTHNRLTKAGYAFNVVPASDVSSVLPELRSVSDAWLARKRTREKGFSIGYFDDAYLERCPVATARVDSRLVAFANVWRSAEKTELSVDLMRFHPDAPNGAMDFLFIELMRWGNAEGYQRFGLGMAPLAGLDQHSLSPVWNRIGAAVYRHGEHFYNFQGLR